MKCKYCKSENTIKYGKSNGKQCYYCKDCNHKFVDNGKFVKMRTKKEVIVAALDLYFEGLSVRKVKRQLGNILKVDVSQMAIWKWVVKYSELAKKFVDSIKLEIEGDWHVDETAIKCDGEHRWFWEMIDNETKFLMATHLSGERSIKETLKFFRQAKARSEKRPDKIIVDGLWSYKKAFNKVFYSRYKKHRVEFVRKAGIRARENNNVIERLHGTLKDRINVMRGLRDEETAKTVLNGWFVFYNFIRPHQSLDGETPAKTAGIDLEIDGWHEMIETATEYTVKN